MHPKIYEEFATAKGYDAGLKAVIERTVEQLKAMDTDVSRPGMLLGNIQSGKTRAFIGIIAKAFDEGYDVAVILTKGTRALATQTVQRLSNEFSNFIDDDIIKVYDIMQVSNDLNDFIMDQKLILIVKKEDDNLNRLVKMFHETYPQLGSKDVLIVDDEADSASVGYSKKKNADGEQEMSYNVLAKQISKFRSSLAGRSDFLQVTATPYSLYLQPENIVIKNEVFQPMKPAFTELVPIHSAYIGAKYYFEDAKDPNSPAAYLHYKVRPEELTDMAKTHGTTKKNILKTSKLADFRFAICSYLVGGAIRRIQEEKKGARRPYKSSFIIHTEVGKDKHHNQVEISKALIEAIKELDEAGLRTLFEAPYQDLAKSVGLTAFYMPTFDEVIEKLKKASKEVIVRVINSDNDMMSKLDIKTGELKLDSIYNIFIGGQILDRGITIQSLIGFFYGRNPQRMQRDTVMQHSRMYGARSQEDLAVTRFFTTNRLHDSMRKMYEIDSALREFFENGTSDKSVVFIGKDGKGKIIPCSPNKVMLSNTITVKAHRRLLPIGFQTKSQTAIRKHVGKVDEMLETLSGGKYEAEFVITRDDAKAILDEIQQCFIDTKDKDNEEWLVWDYASYIAVFNYMMDQIKEPLNKNELYCIVRKDRNVNRMKYGGRSYQDAADDGNSEGRIAKQIAIDRPCLMLTRQNGKSSLGWLDAPFYWPILLTQANIRTCVFSTEMVEVD